MFTFVKVIDTIQDSKKQFVNTFVFDKNFREELIKLIDSQSEFAKGWTTSSIAIMQTICTKSISTLKNYIPSSTK